MLRRRQTGYGCSAAMCSVEHPVCAHRLMLPLHGISSSALAETPCRCRHAATAASARTLVRPHCPCCALSARAAVPSLAPRTQHMYSCSCCHSGLQSPFLQVSNALPKMLGHDMPDYALPPGSSLHPCCPQRIWWTAGRSTYTSRQGWWRAMMTNRTCRQPAKVSTCSAGARWEA